MIILLKIFKYHLRIIYFFIKIFVKPKRQVFFLSRQVNEPSINYKYLIDYIKANDSTIKIKVSCKRVSEELNKLVHKNEEKIKISSIVKEIGKMISYYFTLYKQMYYLASSKVVITDGYNVLISTLKHHKDTKIIQMWHALAAIKKFGYQTIGKKAGMNHKTAKVLETHKNYDYILSGSDAMKKYFSEAFNTDKEKILSIGTPYIDYLLKTKPNKKEAYKNYPNTKGKEIILYCPTFRKNGKNVVNDIINKIDLKKYCLMIRLHPMDCVNIPEIIPEGVYLNPDIEYVTLLKMSNYVITDYSAIMIEASIVSSNVLLYVYDYEQYKKENGLNINLFEELNGCVFKDFKKLMKCIDNNKYDRKQLLAFRKKYVTNLKGNSTEEIYKLIKELL